MSKHCTYSPSSATRWMSCTASILANNTIVSRETSSVHADRGTAMHYVAGYYLKRHLERYIDSYVQLRCLSQSIETPAFEVVENYKLEEFINYKNELSESDDEICKKMAKQAMSNIGTNLVYDNGRIITRLSVYLEQRIEILGGIVYGTPDIVVISGFKYAGDNNQITEQHIEVLDFKFGFNKIKSENNKQLMIYALGAMDSWADECVNRKYKLTILQPSNVNSSEIEGIDLVELGVEIDKVIENINAGNIEFVPSDENCQYCNFRYRCKARSRNIIELLKHYQMKN